MPLTVELNDHRRNKYGRLVIDRDNLIIQFLPNSESDADKAIAHERKEAFKLLINECVTSKLRALAIMDTDIDDPRHIVTDHMCITDKGGFHLHFKFNQPINFEIMREFILCIPERDWLAYISQDCYEQLKTSISAYFRELKQSSAARSNEQYYLDEKAQQLKVMNREMAVTKAKKGKSHKAAAQISAPASGTFVLLIDPTISFLLSGFNLSSLLLPPLPVGSTAALLKNNVRGSSAAIGSAMMATTATQTRQPVATATAAMAAPGSSSTTPSHNIDNYIVETRTTTSPSVPIHNGMFTFIRTQGTYTLKKDNVGIVNANTNTR